MANELAYDYAFDTLSDEDSLNTGNENSLLNGIRHYDKYYDKYTIPYNKVGPDGRYHKRLTIETYGSGGLGSYIRNAVTGHYYDFQVGTSHEDFLYKVIDATGRNKRRDPLMLYYDSPEQYENHKHTKVSQATKERWYKKVLNAKQLQMYSNVANI